MNAREKQTKASTPSSARKRHETAICAARLSCLTHGKVRSAAPAVVPSSNCHAAKTQTAGRPQSRKRSAWKTGAIINV